LEILRYTSWCTSLPVLEGRHGIEKGADENRGTEVGAERREWRRER
jgi:hypothetical protein